MEIIEQVDAWRKRYAEWKQDQSKASGNGELGESYPFVKNQRAPFTPARRALPMLNLALISSAGVYIDGTEPFDVKAPGGDLSFREIPIEVEAHDFLVAAKGYDQTAIHQDLNVQVPLERLSEFEVNGVIGQLNPVFWSFSGFITDAGRLADEMLPKLIERVKRYEVQAALLIPASRLCHQSVSLAARALEQSGLPTMTLSVAKDIVESVRPPRAGFYSGDLGSVAGQPNWPEHQRRILDVALRLLEPMDQPGINQLTIGLETKVENERGER